MLCLHYGLPGLRGLLGTVGGFKPRILVGVTWSSRWRVLVVGVSYPRLMFPVEGQAISRIFTLVIHIPGLDCPLVN